MNKYKNGDVVRVKSLEDIKKSLFTYTFNFNEMPEFCGKTFIVFTTTMVDFYRLFNKDYSVNDASAYVWHESWLEPVNDTKWEEI